jgi:endogenous inhibitor of DNA gyrase (YacG/DUF329 family)
MRERMNDVRCPYCGLDQEINHDDGYGYDESEEHEQECPSCRKKFKFTTTITYTYNVSCQDGDHELEPFGDKYPGMYQCVNCDHYERREA